MFDKYYTRYNATLDFASPFNDTTMPLKGFYEIDHTTQLSTDVLISLLIAPHSNYTLDFNVTVKECHQRYSLRDRKGPSRFGFSKSSFNVYPISNFIFCHHLYKSHIAFAF